MKTRVFKNKAIQRVLSVCMAFLLLIGSGTLGGTTAQAAGTQRTATEYMKARATSLNQIGMLSGTGTLADGSPNYDLDRTPNRAEVFTFLIRLMGNSNEATNGTYTHPFKDVPAWADKYVGYAYKTGLTSGTSATTFGASDPITAQQFATLLCRALGYKEGADYTYTTVLTDVVKLGVLTQTHIDTAKTTFIRGDMVVYGDVMLCSTPKNGTSSMIQSLVTADKIDSEIAKTAGYSVTKPETTSSGTTLSFGVKSNDGIAFVPNDAGYEVVPIDFDKMTIEVFSKDGSENYSSTLTKVSSGITEVYNVTVPTVVPGDVYLLKLSNIPQEVKIFNDVAVQNGSCTIELEVSVDGDDEALMGSKSFPLAVWVGIEHGYYFFCHGLGNDMIEGVDFSVRLPSGEVLIAKSRGSYAFLPLQKDGYINAEMKPIVDKECIEMPVVLSSYSKVYSFTYLMAYSDATLSIKH